MPAIYRRVKDQAGKWKYERVGAGRRLPDAPDSPFHLRYTVNGHRKWSEPYKTWEAARSASLELPKTSEAESIPGGRTSIQSAVEHYLDQKNNKACKTVLAYRLTLNQFADLVGVRYLDQITVDALRIYKKALEKKKLAGKTIDTRMNIVYFMLTKTASLLGSPLTKCPRSRRNPRGHSQRRKSPICFR